MTLEEFNSFDDSDKGKILLQQGVWLCDRIHAGLHMYLFGIDQFYVEVFFHPHYEVIQGFRTFTDEEGLQPYLATINIDAVLH